MDTVFILFLLPFFFLLHELEEILMVHRWIEKNGAAIAQTFSEIEISYPEYERNDHTEICHNRLWRIFDCFYLYICESADRRPRSLVLLSGRIQHPSFRPYHSVYCMAQIYSCHCYYSFLPALLYLGDTWHVSVLFCIRALFLHDIGYIAWRSELNRNACNHAPSG